MLPLGQVRRNQREGRRQHLIQVHTRKLLQPLTPGKVTKRGPLTGLEISGGTSRLEVKLPRPKAAVRVRIGAGASNLELIRPAGVPVRVRIGGGASKLAIDEFRVGAGGGKTDWRSPDYDLVEGRYDIEIGAGASKVTVRT